MSAVLFGTLIFLLSASAASARPSLEFAESGARAGDVVHFSITGAEGGVTYELEVDDEDVADGSGWGGVISGTFTMPYMGVDPWTAPVEVVIWGSDRRRKIEREIEYLGKALPVIKLPSVGSGAPSAAAPAIVPQAASSPQPISSPKALEGPSPSSTAATPRSSHRSRRSRKHATERSHEEARSDKPGRRAHRSHNRRHRRAAIRSARAWLRAWRRAFRTAPYPDPSSTSEARGHGGRIFSLNAIAPETAVLAANRIRSDDGTHTAVVVPALLGLAALTLAGTAVLRRRRLASPPKRD